MNKTVRRIKLAKRIKAYRKDPVLFFREVLQFEPDPWQEKVARDLAVSPKVSVRSGQGVGKTGVEAALLLWFLCCFQYPRIVATAPTRQQLNDVLWSEVAKWLERSPILSEVLKWTKTYIYMIGHEKRWFAVARTATKAENMQGFHEDNMLFIVDEASGVADDIMEAIQGTLSGENNKLLMCGNPTRTSGVFYESHTSDRDQYKVHKVNSLDSDRTNKDNIKSLIRKYGAESNVVRVRVYGEFPLQEDDVFMPISLVEKAVNLELFKTDEEEKTHTVQTINIGVDVARYGDDETIIATILDKELLPLKVRHGQNLMATVGDILILAKKLHEKYPVVMNEKGVSVLNVVAKIDDTGLGGGVTDRLVEIKREQGLSWLKIVPVNFASGVPKGVKDSHYYDDIITYMWAVTRDLMEKNNIKLPNDGDLVGQLTTRKYYIQSNGKIRLESKKEMKKRGLKSPDRADAVVLACMPVIINKKE